MSEGNLAALLERERETLGLSEAVGSKERPGREEKRWQSAGGWMGGWGGNWWKRGEERYWSALEEWGVEGMAGETGTKVDFRIWTKHLKKVPKFPRIPVTLVTILRLSPLPQTSSVFDCSQTDDVS